jgi:hypothetical protein
MSIPTTGQTPIDQSRELGFRGAQLDEQLLEIHGRMLEQLGRFVAMDERYQRTKDEIIENVKAKAGAVLQERLHEELVKHTVRELGEFPLNVPPGSIRLLEGAGLHTLADLNRYRSKWAFTAFRGIGEVKSQEIHEAHMRLRRDIRASISIAFEEQLDDKDVQLLDALQQVQILTVAERGVAKQHAVAVAAAETIERYAEDAAPLHTRFAWLFPNAKKKLEAREAIAKFGDMYRALPLQTAAQPYARFFKAQHEQATESIEQTIADFEAEPAAFYSLLARYLRNEDGSSLVDPSSGAIMQAGDQGNVDSTLWDSILATELDLDGLTAILRPYQEFGAKFLVHQHHTILGDDPGTGKTLQSLAYMVHITNKYATQYNVRPTHMVIAPLSVQGNWVNEIKKHSTLTPYKMLSKNDVIPAGTDIIVATYERAHEDMARYITGAIVIDEAHFIKNTNTARTQRVRRLIEGKRDVVLLSGTALENRLEELNRLVGFVNPEIGMRLHNLGEHADIARYREILAEVYLRRNKEDVVTELPPFIEVLEMVEMAPEERERYTHVINEQPHPWHGLRQLGYERREFAKVRRIAEIIAEAQAVGEKVLIFSFYLEPLNRLQAYFKHLPAVRVDGDVDPEQRQGLVDELNAHEGTMLYFSQINTGGVGLNLQAANRVIILEPQIKPSLVIQAVARAHRMGQRRTVTMHMMMAEDTLDQGILELQQAKEELFNDYARQSELGERSAKLTEITVGEQAKILAAQKARYRAAA